MMKRFDKKENLGITLIALVITIIILLILAGISIAQLTGNGLFEKAKLAKEASKNAQDDEEEKIQQYSNEINGYIGANRNFTAIDYSEEEQDTGLKWVDKKTIYQKTVIATKTITSGNYATIGTIANVDTPISVEGMVRDNGSVNFHNLGSMHSFINFQNTGNVNVTVGTNYTNSTFMITCRYTKK